MNLGFQEILVVALIALIVVGPERLPEMARKAGEIVARIRTETSKSMAELKRAAEIQDLDRELKAMRAELRQAGREFTGTAQSLTRSSATAAGYEPPPPTDPEAT